MQQISDGCFLDIESSSFYPFYGRLIVVGIKDVKSKDVWIFHDEKEYTLIREFLKFFDEKEYTTVVGFNIRHDFRFIFAKCLKYQIPAGRFFQSSQIDIMEYMKGSEYSRPGKFQEWMGSLGRPSQRRPSIRDLYNRGKLEEIIVHNEEDLNSMDELWQRINLVMSNTTEGDRV
jgi:predicted PolB exonuclease-like 3'-5' exonuclease